MFHWKPSKENLSSPSSAIANSAGPRGIALPAPSSQALTNRPVQFTLEDAQRMWRQRLRQKSEPSRDNIERYIRARKMGWPVLEMELNKAPNPNLMDVDTASENSDDTMQIDEENGPDIHPDDLASYEDILMKQYIPISDGPRKVETDIRKFNAAAIRSRQARERGHHELGMPLNTFFRKNAPPGYNNSTPDDDMETNEYQYNVQYERDFTFGLSRNPNNSERTKTDYFRAPFHNKHVIRKEHEDRLKKYMKTRYPEKDKKMGQKQVYVSFNVKQDETNRNKLHITSASQPYNNNNMLGSRSGKTVVQCKINVAGHDLYLWINTDSAGHQSTYNACAIVPNFIQYEQIMSALQLNNTVNIDPSVNIQEKSFRSRTRKAILGKEPGELPTANYKKKLLKDRRQLVTNVSNIINARVKNKYIKAITSETQEDFLQYPCLVLEPRSNYARDFGGEKKEVMEGLKEAIVFAFHDRHEISFANRTSFGFAYPTVGDVGVAVRIWPGLIPAATFSYMILEALKMAGLLNDFKNKPTNEEDDNAPLILALKLAIIRAQKRFSRYRQIKASNNGELVEKDTYKWVNNRITSNVLKADVLVEALAKKPGDQDLIKRAIRTLENLNEYELILAGVEEEQSKEPEQDRKTALSTMFKQRSVNRAVQDYELVSETICSSGMDAYRMAMETIGDIQKDSSRLYFETAKVNKTIKEKSRKIGGSDVIDKSGSITKMQDPSYNFVNMQDLESNATYEWDQDIRYPSVHIYDITNTPIATVISKARPSDPNVIVLFESFSKHFQFGMDKTTIGRLIVYVRSSRKNRADVKTLTDKFKNLKDTPLPNYFLNYMAMQNELYGE